MGEEYWTKCLHCGKDVLMPGDDPAAKCLFCRQPARIKDKEVPKLSDEQSNQKSEEASAVTNIPPVYEGQPLRYRRGIRNWGKVCRECEYSYIHDEQTWCSSKKCPSHCPPRLRPSLRPKIEEQKEPHTVEIKRAKPKPSGASQELGHVHLSRERGILPPLPEFRSSWFKEVQVEWLQTRFKLELLDHLQIAPALFGPADERFSSIMEKAGAAPENNFKGQEEKIKQRQHDLQEQAVVKLGQLHHFWRILRFLWG
jgi:hypothetical protein